MRNQILIMLSSFCMTVGLAYGHSWYDSSCCSGNDCAMIETDKVTATDKGWWVHLEQKDHPLAPPEGIDQIIYYGEYKIRTSKDENFHLCLSPSVPGNIYCLYVPPMGF